MIPYSDPTFWRDIMANLIPDLFVAIIFGVWISGYLSKKEGDEELEANKNNILSLIKQELLFNLEFARGSLKSIKEDHKLAQPGMKTEIWDFFSNSGDMKWLKNEPMLLHQLSTGYHSIKSINLLEPIYLEAWLHFANTTRSEIIQRVEKELEAGYSSFIKVAENFLETTRMKEVDLSGFIDLN